MAKLPRPTKVNLRRIKSTIPQTVWLPTERIARWPRSVVMILVILIVVVFMSLLADSMLTGQRSNFQITLRSETEFAKLPACEPSQLASTQFAIETKLIRKWHLIGKEFLSKDPLAGEITLGNIPINCAPRDLQIEYRVEGKSIEGRQQTANKTAYSFNLDIESLGVGTYSLVTDIKKQDTLVATNTQTFYVSKPVYVAWTLDWEGYNFSDEYLNYIQELTNREQKVPLTHFFNPAYSVAGGTLKSRGTRFANWIKERQPTYGDEVGLHLHMFYYMVQAAGVTPLTDPTWGSRGTGSDVPLSSYTLDEQRLIINWGKKMLNDQGFNNLMSFRAGGWYADEDTFKVLEDTGFKIESSGRTAYSLGNGLPGLWDLRDTTQPYYPCKTNKNQTCSGNNAFKVMEIPNNGGESYRFTVAQLSNRFKVNYNGQPQEAHRAITYLSHPEWFNVDRPKMTEILKQVDEHLFAADRGPVIYATLETIYYAWEANK